MKFKVAVIMDPIASIHYKKDTTLALLLEAQKRQWPLFYLEQKDLYLQDGTAWGLAQALQVRPDPNDWYKLEKKIPLRLQDFDIILMRKDPPFDMEYIYTTYILEFAKSQGVLVVNDPQSLRDANEKLFAQWFPHCMPPTIVAKEPHLLRQFIVEYKDVVFKPLDSMGGGSVFHLKKGDDNINVVIEVLTHYGQRHIMAQRFIPEITHGDKRIFIIDGKPLPYALGRLPLQGEIRGNLAAGGHAKGFNLTERDYWIGEQVGSILKRKGLLFVGIDVIGNYLTEINVTSPTCVRELESFYDIDVCKIFFDALETNYLRCK